MSVYSHARTKGSQTPSSILKKPTTSIKSRLSSVQTPSKVRFILPHSKKVKHILQQFVENNVVKDYENLVCLIRDAELLDSDISSLLKEATECISILNRDLSLFVEVILTINWIERNADVVNEYRSFIVNLLAAHNYHTKYVIDKIVSLFIPKTADVYWENGPSDCDCTKCEIIHGLIEVLLTIVPMCKELLLTTISKHYPYYNKPLHIQEFYLHNLLWILKYQPGFRQDILGLIFSKLIIMDVNAPKEEIERQLRELEEENEMKFDDSLSVKSSIKTTFTLVNRNILAQSLDVCMRMIFEYLVKECSNDGTGELDYKKAKKLYQDLEIVFDTRILPTYNLHHVQFVMFVTCCLDKTLCANFINYLWGKVCNPNVSLNLRQTAVSYVASLVARGAFVSTSDLQDTLRQMSDWIHSYIANQDSIDCINSDVRVHSVFYTLCQALFYLISARHTELLNSKKKLAFMESLNLGKIVTCRLNPLRVCRPNIAQNFAAITRKYQLAYCYSIIDHNTRNIIPTIYQDERGSSVVCHNILNGYYPFEPYILERSRGTIDPIYRTTLDSFADDIEGVSNEMDTSNPTEDDVDDFLCGSPPEVSYSKKRKLRH